MKFYRDQGSACVNQTLRILTNILAAGAFHSSALLDDVISSLIGFTGVIISMPSFDGNALIVKVWLRASAKLIVTVMIFDMGFCIINLRRIFIMHQNFCLDTITCKTFRLSAVWFQILLSLQSVTAIISDLHRAFQF